MTKTKTPAEITARLAEIENEQAELAATDYDALLAQAIVNGEDADAVEDDQAQTERRQRRLRIEQETLTGMLPEARRIEAQPEVDKLKKQHAAKMKEAADAVAAALEHWENLKTEVERFQRIRNESIALTNQARVKLDGVDAPDPANEMGPPMSRLLSSAGEHIGYLGNGLRNWSALPLRDGMATYGLVVDPRPGKLKGVA